MKFRSKEKLAEFAIEYFLKNEKILDGRKEDVDSKLWEEAACFVTVYVDNKLRGCIGDINASEALYKNIIRNAIAAAFSDFRFPSIQTEDLPMLKTEVSVLTPPEDYQPKNVTGLIEYLEREKPGLILEKYGRKALFLPQVWQEIKKPSEFLSHLCLKASLDPLAWQNEGMKFWTFKTIK
jgi:AmmeMemoRadiSam system protein A